jgi:uncharacterized protein YkwD
MRTVSLFLGLALAAIVTANEPVQPVASKASLPQVQKPAKPALHEHPTLVSMLQRNNAMRQSMGLPPHRMSPALTKAAQDHAWFMARTRAFSHESNGGPMFRAQRYGYRGLVRENIAMGQFNVSHVFGDWRASGGHWANITSPTRDAGFGYAVGPDGSGYWVALYGDGSAW